MMISLTLNLTMSCKDNAASCNNVYHRRRSRGGGTCPHKLQVGGAVPPQPELCQDAILGRTMIHSMNINSYRVYLTYSLFLHCYNQETLSKVQTLATLMQKWVWFLRNVGVVQNFPRTLCAQLISYASPNIQHLPTPLCIQA